MLYLFHSYSSQVPIIPGVEMKVEMNQTNDAIRIMQDRNCNRTFKIEVSDPHLFCLVGTLQQPIYKYVKDRINHEHINIPYRRVQMMNKGIARGQSTYSTETLFTGAIPCKIHVMFLESDAYAGNKFKVKTMCYFS